MKFLKHIKFNQDAPSLQNFDFFDPVCFIDTSSSGIAITTIVNETENSLG